MFKTRRFPFTVKSSISNMRHMCPLVAMLMMCSVTAFHSGNLREETERETSVDGKTNNIRRQDTDTVLCGRRPSLTSKRHVGAEDFDDEEMADHLDKILGGSLVTRGEVPWQANVYVNGRRLCGGTVVSEFWVLTAAECVIPMYTQSVRVVVGDHSNSQVDDGQQTFDVQQIIDHAQYNGSNNDNNIALLKVANTSDGRGIRFNNYVQPICLPAADERPAIGAALTVTGWGRTSVLIGSASDILKKAVLPVVSKDTCTGAYDCSRVTDRMLCAGLPDRDSDVCSGDNGGPATYTSGGIYILAGLISSGSGCYSPQRPIILTSAHELKEWVTSQISAHSNGSQSVIPSRQV